MDELESLMSLRLRVRFIAELRARADREAADRAPGQALGGAPGVPCDSHEGSGADAETIPVSGLSRGNISAAHCITSWEKCRRCGYVEVPRGDHPRAGRCPKCGRNV